MKYPALRFISKVYRASAYVFLTLSVLCSILFLVKQIETSITIGLDWNDLLGIESVLMFATILFGGSFIALINLAISEVLSVVMDIEANTRK